MDGEIAKSKGVKGIFVNGVKNFRKKSVGVDVMGDGLTDFFSAGFAGFGRDQSDGFHFVGPFAVMEIGAGGGAKLVLPKVDHLVDKCRMPFDKWAKKVIGIKGNFM